MRPQVGNPRGRTPGPTRPLLERGEAWEDYAACVGRDPRFWFSNRTDLIAAGKAICAACPVAAMCALKAERLEEGKPLSHLSGTWGGETVRERQSRRRRARRAGVELEEAS